MADKLPRQESEVNTEHESESKRSRRRHHKANKKANKWRSHSIANNSEHRRYTFSTKYTSGGDEGQLCDLDSLFAPAVCEMWTIVADAATDLRQNGYVGQYKTKDLQLPLPLSLHTPR